MSSLYIVIPAYNESANIERTIDQWYPVVERHNDEGKSRLVIINDGSKDRQRGTLCQTVWLCATIQEGLLWGTPITARHSKNEFRS